MAKKWQHSEDPTIQKVGYKKIVTKHFILPDGRKADFTTYGVAGTRNTATIALTKDGQIIIARQFRPGPELIFDELPGGGAEASEELAEAASRELREETGYTTESPLEYLGSACRDAYMNEVSHYFLARDCHKTDEQQLDDTEFVEVAIISIEQLIENAKTRKMSDSVGVLMAYDKLMEVQNGATSS